MILHFHVGNVPVTLQIGKDPEQAEKDQALLWYALRLPREGWLARFVMRKYARRRQ